MPVVFAQADKNGDGFVTPDEFVAYLEQRQGERRGKAGQRRAPVRVAASDGLIVKRDIRYRETPGVEANLQSLDIYAPKDAKNLPVMIYIHGGGWQRGDKAAVGSKPAYFCSRGWVFVSLNYRFVPEVDLLTQLQDSADAIAWVHTHIADHGGNPQTTASHGTFGRCASCRYPGDERTFPESRWHGPIHPQERGGTRHASA